MPNLETSFNDYGHELEEDYDILIGATVFQCRLCRATGVYGDCWLGGITPEIFSETCSAKMKRTNPNIECSTA